MNVVTRFAGNVLKAYPDYPFINPTTYAGVAELLAPTDKIFNY